MGATAEGCPFFEMASSSYHALLLFVFQEILKSRKNQPAAATSN